MTRCKFVTLGGLAVLVCVASGCAPTAPPVAAPQAADTPQLEVVQSDPQQQAAEELAMLPPIKPRGIDHSGRKQAGRASYYAQEFTNRVMANGNRFNPESNVAASKNLPLGTTAKVTNLRNGMSATVRVEDRGPFIDGRIVDVTPKVAEQLGMKRVGVTPVVVAPITVPQPDGAVKLGAGAAEAMPEDVQKATQQAASSR
jgi:rare lipoprotein A